MQQPPKIGFDSFEKESWIEKISSENNCTPDCQKSPLKGKMLLENIEDVADCLVQIMRTCGINIKMEKDLLNIIFCAFLNYNEIVNVIDKKSLKEIRRDDLIHELGRQCDLSHHEARFTYRIIKLAFKAFYCCTDGKEHSDIDEAAALDNSQEQSWAYAAKRTADIYAGHTRNDSEMKRKTIADEFKNIYTELQRRMQQRMCKVDEQCCECENCEKKNTVMQSVEISKSALWRMISKTCENQYKFKNGEKKFLVMQVVNVITPMQTMISETCEDGCECEKCEQKKFIMQLMDISTSSMRTMSSEKSNDK